MSRMLQTQLESARDEFSDAVGAVFYELGKLYVEGYGGDGWGCTQNTRDREDNIEWVFKYTTEDNEVQFVKAEYSYDVPNFELNRFNYQMERNGSETKERDVFVVSQYSPPNVWSVNHVADSVYTAIGNYLTDLSGFAAHPDDTDTILANNPPLKNAIEALKDTHESFSETIETVQAGMSMTDLIESIEDGHNDLTAVGICDDEEDKDSVWKLFHRFSDDGVEDAERTIHFSNDTIALIEVQQQYHGDEYTIGYVVGVDDGETPFFIHRLRSTDEVEEHEGEWTEDAVYELMGFDRNLESDEIGYGTRYRVQGDVYFERRELQNEKESFAETHAKNTVRNAVSEYAEEFLEQQGLTEHFDINTYIYTRLNSNEEETLLTLNEEYDTDTLKELQDEMNISEEKVRQIQEQREWSRLSQKRRRTIIRDIIEERLFQWVSQSYDVPVDELWDDALTEQRAEFEDAAASCPITLGNHLLNIRNALIHPNSSRRLEEDIEVIVPTETQLYVLHDEHNSKIVTIPEGIYTFGFLEQHFNA